MQAGDARGDGRGNENDSDHGNGNGKGEGTSRRYLELLAQDAPAEQLEVLLRSEVRAGGDETALAAVHDLATRAHSLRLSGRRRESELAALNETVSDLAALKDLDDVLQAIVRRARTLLRADVSYLTLNDDEAGYTYMRVTHGIHSEEFRNVRLHFGEGLGGLVAQTARPYATGDYFNDERFRHTSKVDSAVGREEINAILAVPLLLGRTVIGVLYAANHARRVFDREDINLLSSFAGHAALAIDNAHRSQESASALADLRETGRLLRTSAEGSQRAADAHDRLAQVVLQGGDLADVAGELQAVLGEPVLVLDAQGSPLTSSDPGWAPDDEATDVVGDALRDNRTHVRAGLSVAPVWAGSAPIAAVLVRAEVDEVNRRILEQAATTTALIMVVQRNASETEARMRGDLLVDVLLGRAGTGSLAARASMLGADLSSPHVVVVASGADPTSVQRAKEHASATGGMCAEVGERLVLVLPGREALVAGRYVVERAGAPGPTGGGGAGRRQTHTVGRTLLTAGVAGPVTGVEDVRAAYGEAGRCLEALLTLGRRGEVTDAASLGFVGMLLGGGSPEEHVTRHLGPVLDYDRERRTALLETLEAWLAEDRHLARTGERLHVHPNTVTQRLDRIGQLLGDGWQVPERLLEVALALRLRQVLPG